ncbi:uncharacterized protein DS421_13g402030 [Arachis hypogaea]|nr:uncharacterized protein DS421_13g402030 [Arachis hypogaea]
MQETSLDIGMDEAASGTRYLDDGGDLGNDVRDSGLVRPEEVMEMLFNSPDLDQLRHHRDNGASSSNP